MIRVILTRDEVARRGACDEGLALYDAIVGLSGSDRVDVAWTPLATVWLAGRYPEFSRWLLDKGLIPVANLRGADLRGADLRGANLYGADLTSADLTRADLYGADLYGANLYGANLRGADLRGADLRGANLYGADLTSADLTRADLYGADRSSNPPEGWRIVAGRLAREVAQ